MEEKVEVVKAEVVEVQEEEGPETKASTEFFEIHIESDGTSARTKVLDNKGRVLKHIKRVDWSVEAPGMAQAVIYLNRAHVNVTAKVGEVRAAALQTEVHGSTTLSSVLLPEIVETENNNLD